MKIDEFLRQQRVPFNMLPHRATYSAQHTAEVLDVPGDNVAKTVLLKADGEYVLAVLQATHAIDFDQAADVLDARSVELASEDEIARMFPDCERGAIPPFGSRYGLKTLVDEALAEDEYVVFEGTSHDQAFYMRYFDYRNIEHPRAAAFTYHV